jgi:16S rRNA (uracil1498-N3)-methyltransferase
MSAPVFLADSDQLRTDRITLAGPEGRHAAAVRRLKPGERVDLTDGAGTVAHCVVVAAGRDTLDLEVTERRHDPPPDPRLTVVQALPKGDRGELAVEMMTEVGVDTIVPWSAARCVTQWRPERRDKALSRWRSTAREAAKQARRSWLPEITDLATTAQVTHRAATAASFVVLHESFTTPIRELALPSTGEIVFVVGPEGGITDEEMATFEAVGGQPTLLGPTVLRTSTAGVAAAAIILTRCARW